MNALKTFAIAAVAVIAAGCAAVAPRPDYTALLQQMMNGSFRDEGIAKTERLKQDAANAACSEAQTGTPPDAVADAIRADALKSVRMPKDGKFLGDWREGEKLAQNGLVLSGLSPDGGLVEMCEIPNHPWFLACQFHPEYKSRPLAPHPLFRGFVSAVLLHAQAKAKA